MNICKFCSSIRKNANSLRNHERLCKNNPEKQLTYFATHQKEIKIRSNQFIKAEQLGLDKPIVSDDTKNKIREANSRRSYEWNKLNGAKISATIKEKVKNGTWHTSLAKHMHYSYNGFDLHGKWELSYAKWLDLNNIRWMKCKESFEYTFNNTIRRYTPDFYLIELNEYVEIKGYQTEKDLAKWSQFPSNKKLTILKRDDLKKLDII